MKTKFHKYIVFALLTFAFVSCSKDETVPPQSAAEFTASATTVKVNEEIQFTNNSQNATAYLWSFGDGTTSREVAPRKSYQSSDVFLVSLVSTGAGGSTISNMEITVTPASGFTVVDEENLVAGIPVQFANATLGATYYTWNFGDNASTTSTEENPSFEYITAGTYTVTLTASGVAGEDTFSKDIVIGVAPASIPELYYIALGDEFIRRLTLDGTGSVNDVASIAGKGGVGLAYDSINQKIYFSDFNVSPEGNIWRINLDGSGLEAIASGINDPYGIALDTAAGKVYWVDDDGNVSKANLDGSSPEIGFFNVAGAQWRAIALDVENNKMYVYDVNLEEIYAVNMDGTSPQVIIAGNYGYALAIDTVNNKIYFDDQREEFLKVANLDGTNIQTIDDNGTRIYGMDIDNDTNKLYWSGRDSGELYSANLDGTGREVLKTGIASPRGMFLKK